MALQIFDEMLQEGCKPNVVTFNSLITACSESGVWQQALQVFELMKSQGCDPDVITYTSVIGAFAGPGHWGDALDAFLQMRKVGRGGWKRGPGWRHDAVLPLLLGFLASACLAMNPKLTTAQSGIEVDDVVCDVLIESLWDSGVESACRRAVAEHRALLRRGVLRMLIDRTEPEVWELNFNGITFGTVVCTLLVALADLWQIHTEISASSGPGMHLADQTGLGMGESARQYPGTEASQLLLLSSPAADFWLALLAMRRRCWRPSPAAAAPEHQHQHGQAQGKERRVPGPSHRLPGPSQHPGCPLQALAGHQAAGAAPHADQRAPHLPRAPAG